MLGRLLVAGTIVVALGAISSFACENALHSLIGYMVVAATEVDKDQLRELSDEKRVVITLKNDMSFKFDRLPRDTWGVAGFKTSVYVFSRSISAAEAEWHRKNNFPLPKGDIYQLLIGGTLHEVQRVK